MAGPNHLLFAAAFALMAINTVIAGQVLVPLRRGMPVYHSLTKRDAGLAFNDTTLLNTTSMLYGNPGNQSSFTLANMTMYTEDHEMIIHSESFVDCLANVICTNNSIIMTFNDNLTLSNTAQQWGWVNGNVNHTIIFLADWPNCRAGLNPQPYRINSTSLDLVHFNITLLGPATSFQEGVPTFDLELNSASAQGVNRIDPATNNTVTTNLTSRALKKGTKALQRGEEALKRRSRTSRQSSNAGKTLRSARSVHKRSIFSAIAHAFKKVVNAVKNAAVAVVNAVKDVAVDIYKTVVDIGKAIVAFVKDVFTNPKAIGKDILHNLLTVGKDLFRDLQAIDKLELSLNPLASLIHATISSSIFVDMNYNISRNLINKTDRLGDQHLSLLVDCTDCGTTGSLKIITKLQISLGGFRSISFTVEPQDFAAYVNLRAKGSGYSSLALSYVHDFFLFPIPNLAFEIPKIIDLGVFYVFSAGVGITSFNGTFDVEAGFNATIKNGATVTYDLFHLSNDHAAGWDFDIEKRFTAKGTFGLTFNTLVINTLAVGIKLFDKIGCGGGLPVVAPLLSTNIEEDYNSQGNVCGNTPPETIQPNGTTNWSNITTQSNLSPGNGPSSSDMSSFNGTLPPVKIAMNATGPENASNLTQRSVMDIALSENRLSNAEKAKRFSVYGDSSAGQGPAMYPNQVPPSSESSSANAAHQSSTQSSSTESQSSSTQSSSTQSQSSSAQLNSTQSRSSSTQSNSTQSRSSSTQSSSTQPPLYPGHQQISPQSQSSSTQTSTTQSQSSSIQSSSAQPPLYPGHQQLSPQSQSSSAQTSSTQSQSSSAQASGTQPHLYPGYQPISSQLPPYPTRQWNSSQSVGLSSSRPSGSSSLPSGYPAVQSSSSRISGYITLPSGYPAIQSSSSSPPLYPTYRWNISQSVSSSSSRASGYVSRPTSYPGIQSSNSSLPPYPTGRWNSSQATGYVGLQSSSSQASGYISKPALYPGIQSSNSSLPPYPTGQWNSSRATGYVGLQSSSSRLSSGYISLATGYAANQTGASRTISGAPVQSSNSTQTRPGTVFPANSTQSFPNGPSSVNKTQPYPFGNFTNSLNQSDPGLSLRPNGTQNSTNSNVWLNNTGGGVPPYPANSSLQAHGNDQNANIDANKHRALFLTFNLCLVIAIGVGAGGGDVKVNFGINSFVPGVTPAVLVTMPKKRAVETELSAADIARSYLDSDDHQNLVKRLSHGSPLHESGHLDKRVEYQLGYAPVVVCKKLYATHCRPLSNVLDDPFLKRDSNSNQWRGPGRPLRLASS